MCYVPGATEVAVASLVTSAISSSVAYMGQQQAAADMNAAYGRNAAASIDAYQGDIEALNLDSMAAQENATQRRVQASREALAARGAARVQAGEAGVGGYSVAAIQRDLGFQEGEQIAAINRNADLDEQRRRLGGRNARDNAQSRINGAPRSRGPSLLALGAELGASAVNAYSMRSQLQAYERQGT